MSHSRKPALNVAGKLASPIVCLAALLAMRGCEPTRQDTPERPETRAASSVATKPHRPARQRKTSPAPFVPKPVRISGSGAVDFDINWPPRPLEPRKPSRRSLLTGQLIVRGDTSQKTGPRITVAIVLTRPHRTDADREHWNAHTDFERYKHWMPYVRGRDAHGAEWLWPNLAHLFKIHGADRIQRYGGWDSGNRVDNDFGGVLIRKLDHQGAQTTERALVSADWRPANADKDSMFNVTHTARSDTFTIGPEKTAPSAGQARVWLVYGDFMTSRAPWTYASGPMKGHRLKKEHDGGILLQFRIKWTRAPDSPLEFTITRETPGDDTGFDWRKWISRKAKWDTPKAKPTLTDRPT